MNLLKYDLYILDYDGCLLDSMPMWRTSASDFIKNLGLIPKEDLDERIPIFTNRECGVLLKEECNLENDINSIMERINEFVDTNYPKVPLKDGAIEILEKLKKNNKKVVLLSASGNHILNLSLNSKGIKNYFFEVISIYNHETLSKVTGSAITYVMEKYNCNCNNTLIIDDTLSTILSAKKLGVDSIAIYDEYSSNGKEDLLKENANLYLTLDKLNKMF